MEIFDIYDLDFIYQEDKLKNNPRTKRRPVLVLGNDLFVPVAKITGINSKTPKTYEIKDWEIAGLDKPSYIIFDRQELLSNEFVNSNGTFRGHLSENDIQSIKSNKLHEYLKEESEPEEINESLTEDKKRLNNIEKQIYINALNEAEDIDDLKDIVHEIFFYDKSLFVMLRHFPKDMSFEDLRDKLIEIIQSTILDEDLLISPEKEYLSKSGHRLLIKDVEPYVSEYDGSANLRIKYDYKLKGSDEWGSSECNHYDFFNMLKEDYQHKDDGWGNPYTFDEVEKELKNITNDWLDEDGNIRCYWEQEKEYGKQILKNHYKYVDISDGRTGSGQDMSWVLSYSKPIEKVNESFYKSLVEGVTDNLENVVIDCVDWFILMEMEFPKNKFLATSWEDLKDGIKMGLDPIFEVAEGIQQYFKPIVTFNKKYIKDFEEEGIFEDEIDLYKSLVRAMNNYLAKNGYSDRVE